ncbi:hypothetical protein M9H77_09377 [Catharanthus roseus]|uniref:Uncharacterized protein n=1 Tax=Catharanthus roseus TaxID=4058 RepID=A0ACC0C0F6_CATRO|nr:hypothetical protein M9H77_09377 [Catharanthus roseus]
MNLNCLTCQGMKRTDSDNDIPLSLSCELQKPPNINKLHDRVNERSWSGNLVPRPPTAEKLKKSSTRRHSSGTYSVDGTETPRLVRSSGMRREWSFEDLRQRNALRA